MGKVYRIGTLTVSPAECASHFIMAFEVRLKELGYVKGSNADATRPRRPGERVAFSLLQRASLHVRRYGIGTQLPTFAPQRCRQLS
jgi:hypothetical protein